MSSDDQLLTTVPCPTCGMVVSLRDLFAAAALARIAGSETSDYPARSIAFPSNRTATEKEAAKCYEIADALLAERAKR